MLLFSCDEKRVFDEYQSVRKDWHKDSVVTFELPSLDSKKLYNLYVNVRNNDDYPFNNLFLIEWPIILWQIGDFKSPSEQ
jgi:gliding motility-associated lipoprotein GldH